MNCKRLMLIAVLAIVGGRSWATTPESLGFAESKNPYQIERSEGVIAARADTLTKVLSGDKLNATDRPVRVQTHSGDTVMLQNRSSAEFSAPNKMTVLSGDVLVAISKTSDMKVGMEGLEIDPIKADDKLNIQHLVSIETLSADRVKISGFNRPIAIKETADDKQLAVVGDKESVILRKTENGWVVAQDAPEVVETDQPAEEQPQDEDEDKKQGGAWWLSGLGAGILGALLIGGIIAIIAATRGHGGGHDREETSPVVPPDEGGGE